MQDKLLIIDGLNLMFQMFFGMPNKIANSKGEFIQGVVGFTGALLKIINIVKPTHLVVLFDSETSSERTQIDENYKANRPDYSQIDEDESPFKQLQVVYKVLDYLNVAHCEVVGGETDDAICSYVKAYQQKMDIVISSFDSDFFQLVNDNVTVLRYRGKASIICDERYIISRYNIFPSQYALFKSLVGDSADNIKGVKQIGPKTAARLINQYLTLLDMLKSDCCDDKTLKLIQENQQLIEKNLSLIELKRQDLIPIEIGKLKIPTLNYKTMEILYNLEILP